MWTSACWFSFRLRFSVRVCLCVCDFSQFALLLVFVFFLSLFSCLWGIWLYQCTAFPETVAFKMTNQLSSRTLNSARSPIIQREMLSRRSYIQVIIKTRIHVDDICILAWLMIVQNKTMMNKIHENHCTGGHHNYLSLTNFADANSKLVPLIFLQMWNAAVLCSWNFIYVFWM